MRILILAIAIIFSTHLQHVSINRGVKLFTITGLIALNPLTQDTFSLDFAPSEVAFDHLLDEIIFHHHLPEHL